MFIGAVVEETSPEEEPMEGSDDKGMKRPNQRNNKAGRARLASLIRRIARNLLQARRQQKRPSKEMPDSEENVMPEDNPEVSTSGNADEMTETTSKSNKRRLGVRRTLLRRLVANALRMALRAQRQRRTSTTTPAPETGM